MVNTASLLLAISLVGPLSAAGARSAGMGYIGVSSSSGLDSFYHNPSGISLWKGWDFEIIGITDDEGIKTAGFIRDRWEDIAHALINPSIGNLFPLLEDERAGNLSQTLVLSSAFGYCSGRWAAMVKGIGLSLSEVRSIDPTGLDTHLSLILEGDLEVRGGFSQRISLLGMEGYLGLAVKYIQVRESRKRVDEATAKGIIKGIAEDLSSTTSGLGFDVGIMLKKRPFSLGLSLMDIYGTFLKGPNNSYQIGQTVNFGISVGKPDGPIMMGLDFLDILSPGDPLKKLQIGMEGRPLSPISIRLGVNDGYPCFGFGIRFSHVGLDYSRVGVEVGSRIGEVEKVYHIVSVSYRF